MTPNEIILAIFAPLIALGIFLVNFIQRLTKLEACIDPADGERLARLETKMDFMIKWIATLNGEMSDKKEFKEFLEHLKEVAKEKGL